MQTQGLFGSLMCVYVQQLVKENICAPVFFCILYGPTGDLGVPLLEEGLATMFEFIYRIFYYFRKYDQSLCKLLIGCC